MADKKISALTSVAESAIDANDLLHIVDDPGGTPVNKKMTISQLFKNIPTTLAIDNITTHTTAATDLASSFASAIDGAAWGAHVSFTLDNGTHTGQLKTIYAKTEPASSYEARISVTNWGYSSVSSNQIVLNSQGDCVICMWDGSKWYVISSTGAVLT
jgi:hypothetical protein